MCWKLLDLLWRTHFWLAVYRYENYLKQARTAIWSEQHEIFALAGPRYSFGASALSGLFLEGRVGPGYTTSPAYNAVTFLVEPSVGYSWAFNAPGLYMALGAGVLINFPLWQSKEVLNFGGKDLSLIGWLVHQTIPTLNLTIGLGL